jgi:hypothetical protein
MRRTVFISNRAHEEVMPLQVCGGTQTADLFRHLMESRRLARHSIFANHYLGGFYDRFDGIPFAESQLDR